MPKAKRKSEQAPLTAEQYAQLLAFEDKVTKYWAAFRIPNDAASSYVNGTVN